MKRRIVIGVLICFLCAWSLASCTAVQEGTKEITSIAGTEEAIQEHDVLTENSGEPDTLETSEPDEDPELADLLQRKTTQAIVKIVTRTMTGSGCLYRMDEEHLYVLTAAHVVTDWPDDMMVILYDGLTLPCRNILKTEGADVAFLELAMEDIPESKGSPVLKLEEDSQSLSLGEKVYFTIPVDKTSFDELKEGDRVVAIGSVMEVAQNAYEGTVKEPYIYSEDFGDYILVAKVYVHRGMSGGVLVDDKGYFAGVLCGVVDRAGVDEAAIVPLSIVRAKEKLLFP